MNRQLAAFVAIIGLIHGPEVAADQPNVILIMTDDQGYGDLGFHQNPVLRTPHLDALARRAARWGDFYVSPVCTPTRASLMTGRYNYRTRAIDTYRGRAMMDPDEQTIAELLKPAGYATGIFGKWHLGDCYPLRAIDQGFDMALVHRGGGIGQPSDPPGAEGKYADPTLFRNGKAETGRGYCTDVYFTEGMKWADEQLDQQHPFFLYLPTNAPHDPLHDVPADKLAYYRQQAIHAESFASTAGHSPKEVNADQLSRVYAMIENIDDNVGRLFRWLDERRLTDKTLVIFLTDNGPASTGWNAGLRGRKSEVFDGGIRSPAFFHWPGQFPAGPRTGRIAAHIDITPTLLEICGAASPDKVKLDGRSLAGALKTGVADWPERTLFIQSHRGDVPFPRHHCAVRSERWKLVHLSGFGKESFAGDPKWMLFDLQADRYEQHDLAAQQPEIVAELQRRYDDWFADVSQTRNDNFAPPRIVIGSPQENPTILSRQDWRGANWQPQDQGFWLVTSSSARRFQVTLRFRVVPEEAKVTLQIGDRSWTKQVMAGATQADFEDVDLPAGDHEVRGGVQAEAKAAGVMFAEFEFESR